MGTDSALEGINHIVVVMMENRSFDHMLGYLKRDWNEEVNGLTGEEFNLGPDGSKVAIKAFDADAHSVIRPGEAFAEEARSRPLQGWGRDTDRSRLRRCTNGWIRQGIRREPQPRGPNRK